MPKISNQKHLLKNNKKRQASVIHKLAQSSTPHALRSEDMTNERQIIYEMITNPKVEF